MVQQQETMAMAQWNFSRRQCNSYGVYVILTKFLLREWQNGDGRTATEWWKPGIRHA